MKGIWFWLSLYIFLLIFRPGSPTAAENAELAKVHYEKLRYVLIWQ